MKFPAKSSANFEIVPAGQHVAICNAVVDLGMQPGSAMYPDPKRQVYIRFELPAERIQYTKDGREMEGPMSIGRTFTASMHEKASVRKFIESMFGKNFPSDEAAEDFDFKALLGRKCLLNVTHNERAGKSYANIQNVGPIPKGMPADYPQHNPSLYYSLDDPNASVLAALPEWIQKKIAERIQSEPATQSAPAAEEFSDEIPF